MAHVDANVEACVDATCVNRLFFMLRWIGGVGGVFSEDGKE